VAILAWPITGNTQDRRLARIQSPNGLYCKILLADHKTELGCRRICGGEEEELSYRQQPRINLHLDPGLVCTVRSTVHSFALKLQTNYTYVLPHAMYYTILTIYQNTVLYLPSSLLHLPMHDLSDFLPFRLPVNRLFKITIRIRRRAARIDQSLCACLLIT